MPDEMVVELEPQYVDIAKAHELEVAGRTFAGTSKQRDEDIFGTPEEAIRPPMDLEKLARLSQLNGIRRSIIDAIARNTVGLGYTIQLVEGEEGDVQDDKGERFQVRQALESAASRDKRLDRPSFTELLMAVKTDEEEVGNGYMEVSRSKTSGLIDGLFHVPGKRVRRRVDRTGFVMVASDGSLDKGTPFYNFGEKVEYDSKGNPEARLLSGKDWGINELLPFRIYTSESRDYGLPRDAGIMLDYVGDKLAAESNISFFDSSGTPPTIIFVSGEESNQGGRVVFKVPQQTVERIANTLKSDSGHRHRVGLVPLPPGSDVEAVQLGQISDRDMGFTEFRKDNKNRQLATFRLSPIFVSQTDDAGRYTAEVQRAISLEQVFDPEQSRYETRLHNTLLKDMGFPRHRVVFKRLAVEAAAAERDSADKMAEAGTITRREHRAAHGKPPLPEAGKSEAEIEWNGRTYKSEEPEPGQVPHGWNDELLSTGRPEGAENRVVEGTGQQGLRPGIGARRRRQPTAGGESAAAEGGAASLKVATAAAGRAATQRASERAGSNGGS